jgi:pyruvate-formate lyase-activating enzyme
MDIKAPLDARYAEVAGRAVRLETLSSSMHLLRAHAPAYEFRTTAGPQIDEQALIDIASALAATDPWFLQVYQEAPGIAEALQGQPALGGEELRRIAERLRQWTPNVQVRGI